MKIPFNKRAGMFGFGGVILLGSFNVQAQVSQAPTGKQLDEIIVTAQKRSQSAQSVPISITALSGEKIENSGVDGISDLDFLTPGLNVNQRGFVWAPYIRGIGTLDITAGQEAGVATYIDGVYLSSPYGSALSFNNIDRVEILKGPQGTLFGRNATGGLIHVITKDPSEITEVKGSVGIGNYETYQGNFYVGGGISESLVADLALSYKNRNNGFGDNVFLDDDLPGFEETGLRSKWIYSASDKTTVTLIGDYQKQEGGLGSQKGLLPGSVFIAGPGLSYEALPDFQDLEQDTTADAEIEIWGLSAHFVHHFDTFDFKSITAYREVNTDSIFSNDSVPIPLVDVGEKIKVESFTQEVQFASQSDSRINWIVGAFYMNDDNGYAPPTGISLKGIAFPDPLTGDPASIDLIHNVATESFSIFGEVTFDLNDRSRLILGTRYIRDEKTLTGRTEVNLADGSLFVTIPTARSSETWSEPTWRAAIEYDLNADTLLYASFNKGFRSGAFNLVGVSGTPINPEFVDAYEVGFKTDFLDNRMRLNGALFYSDYTDIQIVLSQGTTTETLNAGEAEIFGFELEGEAILTDTLSTRFGLSYLDTEYSKFGDTRCTERLDNGTTGSFTCNPAGNDMLRAPDLTYNLGVAYDVPVSYGLIGMSLDYFWSDEFNWDPDGRIYEPSYGRLNGQIYWDNAAATYRVTLWGKNLTDEEYSLFSGGQPAIGDQYTAAPPRTFGAELSFSF